MTSCDAHALTPTLSQGERGQASHSAKGTDGLPLPLGEGWGEGDGLPTNTLKD
jgi:hypothetical protein